MRHLTGLFLEHQQYTWQNPVLSAACFAWRCVEEVQSECKTKSNKNSLKTQGMSAADFISYCLQFPLSHSFSIPPSFRPVYFYPYWFKILDCMTIMLHTNSVSSISSVLVNRHFPNVDSGCENVVTNACEVMQQREWGYLVTKTDESLWTAHKPMQTFTCTSLCCFVDIRAVNFLNFSSQPEGRNDPFLQPAFFAVNQGSILGAFSCMVGNRATEIYIF